jgi:hypothetical protein
VPPEEADGRGLPRLTETPCRAPDRTPSTPHATPACKEPTTLGGRRSGRH